MSVDCTALKRGVERGVTLVPIRTTPQHPSSGSACAKHSEVGCAEDQQISEKERCWDLEYYIDISVSMHRDVPVRSISEEKVGTIASCLPAPAGISALESECFIVGRI